MAVFSSVVNSNYAIDLIGGTATLSVVLPAAPTEGNLVCIAAIYYKTGSSGSSILSIQDENAKTYTVSSGSPSTYDSNSGQVHAGYLLSAPAGCGQTITITFADTFEVAGMFVKEFSYTGGPIALDAYTEGTGSGTSVNTPTATVSSVNGLGFAATAISTSLTSGDSPWTDFGADVLGGRCIYDVDIDSNQAVAYTASSSGSWTGMAMTFGAAGGSNTPSNTPSDTPSASATPSFTPSNTPSRTVSFTPSNTPSASATPSFTASNTPVSDRLKYSQFHRLKYAVFNALFYCLSNTFVYAKRYSLSVRSRVSDPLLAEYDDWVGWDEQRSQHAVWDHGRRSNPPFLHE
jgi:hypothetical protein